MTVGESEAVHGALAVPIVYEGETTGLLMLGNKASDYEMEQFLDHVNAGNSEFEAVLEMAMIEVADDSFQPEGMPPLPSWCRSCASPGWKKIVSVRWSGRNVGTT